MPETFTPSFLQRIFQSPLVLRELRVACRSWKLVVTLSVYLLIQCSIFAITVAVKHRDGVYDEPTWIGEFLFVTMSVVQIIVTMMVFPALSATSIASEHEKKSFDLLLLTPLSAWEIAIGKFIAAGIQASVFLIATIPLFAMANMFGGINPMAFFMVLLILILFSVFISFVGVYASSLSKKVVPAAMITYLLSIFIGVTLLILLVVLSNAMTSGLVAGLAPTLMAIFDPTFGEGVYFALSITTTCSLYCTYLFLNTTNRLKATAHNKSTNLRIFWTVVAVIVPLQALFYFLVSRIHSHGSVTSGMVFFAIYVGALMLVPSLSAPSEAVIPSRRVRRSMDKLSSAFKGAGGTLLYPGSLRGVLHSGLISVVACAMLFVAGTFAYGQLGSRNEDSVKLQQDFSLIVSGNDSASVGIGSAPTPSFAKPEQMLAVVEKYTKGEWQGFMLLVATILTILLASAQFSWRFSLSGLSKNLATIIGGLFLVLWLVAPLIIQQIIDSASSGFEGDSIARFSPIIGLLSAVNYGEVTGFAGSTIESQITASSRAGTEISRWYWFMGGAGFLFAGLAGWNTYTYMKVKAKVLKLAGEDGKPDTPPPAPDENQQSAAVQHQQTVPAAPLPSAPEVPMQDDSAMPDLNDIETISDDQPADE